MASPDNDAPHLTIHPEQPDGEVEYGNDGGVADVHKVRLTIPATPEIGPIELVGVPAAGYTVELTLTVTARAEFS